MPHPELFPILELKPTDKPTRLEPLGSKRKFWLRVADQPDRVGLFKFARPGTGEHWAERIAAEFAALLELPHADYDLAIYEGHAGIISWSFLQEGESLTIGNEVLARIVGGYPPADRHGRHRVTVEHTVDTVLHECAIVAPPLRWTPPQGITNGSDVMVGYLLLDAWIGNTDRHDENWGWVRHHETGRMHLAPTFDHASCLGRNEEDARRAARLKSRDAGFAVAAYAGKALSGLHAPGKARPLTTTDAFLRAAMLLPDAADVWLSRLQSSTADAYTGVLERVPVALMSSVAREFALELLRINRMRLLQARGEE